MRILGVDALAFGETEGAAHHPHGPAHKTHEIHLHAALGLVIDRMMGEAIEIDVAIELAIDALEQIEVEGSGDPAPVVIGGKQDRAVLLQIDADEKRGVVPQQPRRIGEKASRVGLGKIADGRA